MSGIAGVIERGVRSVAALEETARKMVAPLRHWGPDADGVWVDADAGVGIGHRRLSIIDLSPAGAQPMVSESGHLAISWGGRIYNASEIRVELEARGVRFQGRSDVEIVLEACAAWGVREAAGRLNGMFAFAVWDRRERRLYLVRDRIGIKPLYYCATPQRFSFASELRGLRAHPGFDPAIDPDAVEAFLALDYIPAPSSIYRRARKLEPGTILRVGAGSPADVEVTPYWTLRDAAEKGASDRFAGTVEEAADELENLLSDAVRRRLVSDVPTGAFLSGGIDSSTVVALMQREASKPVRTLSIGFEKGTFDEAPWARAIAKHLGTDHCEHYISDEEVREHGPAVMGHHDEPFADPSLLPTWFLSRLARTQVTVALSGDGGGTFFGETGHLSAERLLRHPALDADPLTKALIRQIVPASPPFLRRGLQSLQGIRRGWPLLSSRQAKLLACSLHEPDWIHHGLAHGDVGISGRRLQGPSLAVDLVGRRLAECKTLSPSERQQYIDASGYLPDDMIVKVERAGMAVLLEVGMPLLDHRLVEFSFRLPATMKAGAGESKLVLRKVLSRHVPATMFERPKAGFRGPVREWLEGPLREWAADLSARNTILRHSLVNPDALRRADNLTKIPRRLDFRLIALAAWCEAHL